MNGAIRGSLDTGRARYTESEADLPKSRIRLQAMRPSQRDVF